MGFSSHTIIAEAQLSLKKMAIKPNDGIIFISINGKSRELVELMKHALKHKIDFLVLTSNPDSFLAKAKSDNTIIIPHEAAIITNILFTQKLYYIFAFDKIMRQIISDKGDVIMKNAKQTKI